MWVIANLPKSYFSSAELTVSCWGNTGIGGIAELADVSGTGIEFIPKLPKCRVPVSSSYSSYRIVGYKYRSCTEQIPVPPALLPRVFRYLGYVSKPYRTNRKRRVPVPSEFVPTLPGVGYRYRGRTVTYENAFRTIHKTKNWQLLLET